MRLHRIALLLLLSACGPQEEWSPLDGPWDPDHPDAAAILATPEPGSRIDREMAAAGERWFRVRGCLACHPVSGPDASVGPSMEGVTRRRDYQWFRGMVMRPDSMLREDPAARELLEIYRIPMPNQEVGELRTRAIWEYLRREDR
jgi:cytochrome c551/c552